MKPIPDVRIISASWDVGPNVIAFTTTRVRGRSLPPYNGFNLAHHVGDDAKTVAANRQELSAWFDADISFQWLNQVHGASVCRIDAAAKPFDADALVTARKGLACCVLTADCLPVFIAAKDGSEIGIAHAGWRGLLDGVIENTLRNMKTPANELAAYLGPAIGPCHFEVGADVMSRFKGAADSQTVKKYFSPTLESGKYMADLFGLAKFRLTALGVEVTSSDICTVCESETLYSYRHSPVTGRMANVILIKP
jgi:YfiH family protein